MALKDGNAPTCSRNVEGSSETQTLDDVQTTEKAEKEIERLFAAGKSELDVTILAVSDMEELPGYRRIVEARAHGYTA